MDTWIGKIEGCDGSSGSLWNLSSGPCGDLRNFLDREMDFVCFSISCYTEQSKENWYKPKKSNCLIKT